LRAARQFGGGPPAIRVLPVAVALRWKVMPYRVDAGQLHIVTADVPSEAMIRELNRLSELELRFHLIRPNEFENLAKEYLPAPAFSQPSCP